MKKIAIIGMVALSMLSLTACSSNKETSETKVSQSEVNLKQGRFITSDNMYFIDIHEKEVMLGVAWRQNSLLAELGRGVQQNFLTLEDKAIVGKDSKDGKEINVSYSFKNNNQLVLEFKKDWLPGVFKDSNEKDKLINKSGSSLIFSSKSKKDYEKIKDNAENKPVESSEKIKYKSIPSHEKDKFVLTSEYTNYYRVSEEETGTYKIKVLSGNNILIEIGSSENSLDDIFIENMALNGEKDNLGYVSEGYATLEKGNIINLSGGTVEFQKQ